MPGWNVSRDNVSLLGEAAEQGGAIGGGDVQGDAAFVGVEVEPVEAALGMRLIVNEGTGAAHGVATGRLHLDDVGPHVGHVFAAVDAQGTREVQHPVTGEGLAILISWQGLGLLTGHIRYHTTPLRWERGCSWFTSTFQLQRC